MHSKQYSVEHIFRYVTKKTGPHYVVTVYEYSRKGDIVEPADHLPKHFVDVYWRGRTWPSAPNNRKWNHGTRSKEARPKTSNNRRRIPWIAGRSTKPHLPIPGRYISQERDYTKTTPAAPATVYAITEKCDSRTQSETDLHPTSVSPKTVLVDNGTLRFPCGQLPNISDYRWLPYSDLFNNCTTKFV